ncbi:putative HNHc nuclease [Convivina intestini]|uniref:putative HNHc nuclease n=1 Tax=Convivina intestini TaxID=1505726 RepID=UPI0020100CEB|nr:putative HNHc nuclease [Convivina intestini]CAH1857529.1 hypothetical protein R077811_01558 [Convivina intestini]
MELTGKVLSRRGSVLTIELNDDSELYKLDKYDPQHTHQVGIYIDDKRHVSSQQRNFAWAIIGDIAKSEIGGYWASYPNLIYDNFKAMYARYYGVEDFSLSDRKGVKSQTNEFISMLLQFCLDHNVGLSFLPIQELAPEEVSKWEYACLMNKSCVICGKKADLHHLEGSRIGQGNNRNKVNHMGRRVEALCRVHHNQWHHDEANLMAKYHLSGIRVNAEIAQLYRLNTVGGNDDRSYV